VRPNLERNENPSICTMRIDFCLVMHYKRRMAHKARRLVSGYKIPYYGLANRLTGWNTTESLRFQVVAFQQMLWHMENSYVTLSHCARKCTDWILTRDVHRVLTMAAGSELKLDVGAGARNLGSGSTEIVCGARELYK